MDLPGRANCLLSNLSQTHMSRDLAEKPSSTLATAEVNDTGLRVTFNRPWRASLRDGNHNSLLQLCSDITLFKRRVVYVSENRRKFEGKLFSHNFWDQLGT